MLLAAACLWFGCSPPSSSTEAPVQSQIFSHVQIIGTRGVGVGQLNKPRSVAVDRQDNLYVVDMTGRVQKFSSNGVFLLSWQMPQTDLGKPKGMCRDGDGNIIVLEPHYSRLNHFSPAGKLLLQWGEHGTNSGQFSLPRAVAVNSKNEIFVSEYQGIERVQKFRSAEASSAPVGNINGSSTNLLDERGRGVRAPIWVASFGQAGNGPGEFNRAEGLYVDAQDRLYVADSCNHRIQVFSSDGKFLRAYGKPGKGIGEFSYPYDICVDKEGLQYICEFGNSRIQVFDANDRPIEIIGGPGAELGRFSNPWSLALDSAGNLYVADSQNHRVQKFLRKETGERTQVIPKAEIRRPNESRIPKSEIGQSTGIRNADLQSAVSQVFNLPTTETTQAICRLQISHAADYKSALQVTCLPVSVRPSDFGLLSAFGFRPSDFGQAPVCSLRSPAS